MSGCICVSLLLPLPNIALTTQHILPSLPLLPSPPPLPSSLVRLFLLLFLFFARGSLLTALLASTKRTTAPRASPSTRRRSQVSFLCTATPAAAPQPDPCGLLLFCTLSTSLSHTHSLSHSHNSARSTNSACTTAAAAAERGCWHTRVKENR